MEGFQKRLTALEEAKQQALANVNAIAGAIQEVQLWMGELNKPDAPEPETVVGPEPIT